MPEIFSAHKEWASVSEIADVIEPKARSREEFIKECKSGAFDKVKAAYRTFQSVAITGLIDEELVKILPKSLKFIAHNGKETIYGVQGVNWDTRVLIGNRGWIRSDRRPRLHSPRHQSLQRSYGSG